MTQSRRTLGPAFGRLWTALGLSAIGDGVYVAALPLLAATLTRDPLMVSTVTVAEWLPWLMFGLIAGTLLDRWDRRRVMWVVDVLRLLVVGALAVTVLLDAATILTLVVAAFLLGTGRTFFDIAAQAIIPALVSRDPELLGRANGRLQTSNVLGAQFLGPPLGGLLFGLSTGVPFVVDAASFAISAALVMMIRGGAAGTDKIAGDDTRPGSATGESAPTAAPETAGIGSLAGQITRDVTEGLRWLTSNRLLRAMTVLVAAVNLAAAMCLAILVLFIEQVLGAGNIGFGLLLACFAVGGALGSLGAGRILARTGGGFAMVASLYIMAAASIGMGLSTTAWLGGLMMALNGVSTMVFNVVFTSLRQELVPDELLGRVGGTVMLIGFSAMPVGGVLGGVLGDTLGLRSPFLVSGAVLIVVAVTGSRVITNRAIDSWRESVNVNRAPETA
jgi:MFS family permease